MEGRKFVQQFDEIVINIGYSPRTIASLQDVADYERCGWSALDAVKDAFKKAGLELEEIADSQPMSHADYIRMYNNIGRK